MRSREILLIAAVVVVTILVVGVPLWSHFFGKFYQDCDYVEHHQQEFDLEKLKSFFAAYSNTSSYKVIIGTNPSLIGLNEGVFIYDSSFFLPDRKCEVYIADGKVMKVLADMGL